MRLSDMTPSRRRRAIRALIPPLTALTRDDRMWAILRGGKAEKQTIRRHREELTAAARALSADGEGGEAASLPALLAASADGELARLAMLCRTCPPGLLLTLARDCDSTEALTLTADWTLGRQARHAYLAQLVYAGVRLLHEALGTGPWGIPDWFTVFPEDRPESPNEGDAGEIPAAIARRLARKGEENGEQERE